MIHGPVPQLQDYLTHSARQFSHKVALVCGPRRVTYGEIEASANALAHYLEGNGVAPGDRVIVFADNTVETVVSFWAVLKANAVVIVVNPLTKAGKLNYLLNDCEPAAFITDGHLYSQFEAPVRTCRSLHAIIVSGAIDDAGLAELPCATRWSTAVAGRYDKPPSRRRIDIDLAAIIYTSGSTGDPKGVMLTHQNMLSACTSIVSYLAVDEDDVILNVLPLAFDYGLYQMIMACRSGARLVLERSFAFPAQILGLVADEGVTGLPGVPTIFAMLSEFKSFHHYNLRSIRYVTNTGAALPLKHIRMLRDLLPAARIYSMYGLTECKRCTYLPPDDIDRKPLSVGIAIPNTEIWAVDENNERVGPGEVGQLVVRGATVMRGYWRKPEATARRLKPGPLPGEVVLYTGDFCRIDEEGYVYFVGRSDEIIKSRGEKVAPREVEGVLMSLPGVREVAVVGIPDDLLGQAIKAFVVVEEGHSLDEKQLQKDCRRYLESFMVPKSISIVPSLPRTDTEKLNKRALQ